MNFVEELKKQNLNIHTCSQKSGIPYATLYPIIMGQTDLGTCTYNTVEKLANILGYRPDQIVYHREDFQNFRNNLHHKIKQGDLQTAIGIIEHEDVEYYRLHEDYIKMLYLVATVDYISKKYDIPLCNKYNDIRNMRLEKPFMVGDSVLLPDESCKPIEEFAKYNIMEGDMYDAV